MQDRQAETTVTSAKTTMMILVIALPSRHLGGIGLDLMAATLAPHD